ncbi:MAG: Crp/Fnr family transcriptional regulator [Frankia sp.]|nr:Crp/Fnr family transcriptional regulator [Frankia sp.]
MVLSTMRPPDVLGEIALLDGGNRSASAEATEATSVLALPRAAFLQLIRSEPKLAEQVLSSLGRLVRKLSEQASDFVFLDLPSRVAKSLCRLADGQRGMPGSLAPLDGVPVIPITQGRLADMAGGSRQSVNQILGQLAAADVVEVRGRTVRVLDMAALRRHARLAESG